MELGKIKHIPRKLKKELYKLPLLYEIKEQGYQRALDYHARFLPQLDRQGQLIVDTLSKDGTCILPIEELELPSTANMMSRAFYLANKLAAPVEF